MINSESKKLPLGMQQLLDDHSRIVQMMSDDTKQVFQVGTPSAECSSKSKFSPREELGVNIELLGNIQKSSARSSSSNLENNSSFLCP
jgi:hypothetical protein